VARFGIFGIGCAVIWSAGGTPALDFLELNAITWAARPIGV